MAGHVISSSVLLALTMTLSTDTQHVYTQLDHGTHVTSLHYISLLSFSLSFQFHLAVLNRQHCWRHLRNLSHHTTAAETVVLGGTVAVDLV